MSVKPTQLFGSSVPVRSPTSTSEDQIKKVTSIHRRIDLSRVKRSSGVRSDHLREFSSHPQLQQRDEDRKTQEASKKHRRTEEGPSKEEFSKSTSKATSSPSKSHSDSTQSDKSAQETREATIKKRKIGKEEIELDQQHKGGEAVEKGRESNAIFRDKTSSRASENVQALQGRRHALTIMSRPDAPYLDYFRKGLKTAEGRVNLPSFRKFNNGDTIQFHNRHDGILCKIVFLHVYKGFQEMLEKEGIDNMLPQLRVYSASDKMEKALSIYKKFPGSERAREHGVLAIGVQFISNCIPGKDR